MTRDEFEASGMSLDALIEASLKTGAVTMPMLREHIIQKLPALKAQYQYGCRNKCQYLTQRSAQVAVCAMFDKGEYTLIEYECTFCQFWHIGHFSMKQFPPATVLQRAALMDKNQKRRVK